MTWSSSSSRPRGHRQPRRAARHPAHGGRAGRRRRRPARPQDHRRRPQGDARRLRDVRAAQGLTRRSRSSARPAPAPTTRSTTRPAASPSTSPRPGWFVITGAGPGIMQAGAEGAGPERAIGISIRLPFEEQPSDLLAGGDRVVAMKYFFTRKLMLIKESQRVRVPARAASARRTRPSSCSPSSRPARPRPRPVVLLDVPGGTYWTHWVEYVDRELVAKGLVSPEDHELFLATDDVDAAVADIQRFWHSYHSIRWVGDRLVDPPAPRAHARRGRRPRRALRRPAARRHHRGHRPAARPRSPTATSSSCPRLVMRYDARRAGRLRSLIDALNDLPSART